MNIKKLWVPAVAVVILAAYGLSAAEEGKQHAFIGAAACKTCHKKEAKGNQWGKWLEGPHSKAFATLATEEAKAVAAKAGVAGNPQEADQCLSCHVTGHGAPAELLTKKYAVTDGVGCESCHGAGADYKKKKVMESREASIAGGLVVPTAETCQTCHNDKSPTFKGFDFDEHWGRIAHPNPASGAAESK